MTSVQSKRILIFGLGRGADTARRYFEWDTSHNIVGYVVDPEYVQSAEFHGRPVVAMTNVVSTFPPADIFAFVPMGAARMNALRTEKYMALKSLGYRFVSYVHSSNR